MRKPTFPRTRRAFRRLLWPWKREAPQTSVVMLDYPPTISMRSRSDFGPRIR